MKKKLKIFCWTFLLLLLSMNSSFSLTMPGDGKEVKFLLESYSGFSNPLNITDTGIILDGGLDYVFSGVVNATNVLQADGPIGPGTTTVELLDNGEELIGFFDGVELTSVNGFIGTYTVGGSVVELWNNNVDDPIWSENMMPYDVHDFSEELIFNGTFSYMSTTFDPFLQKFYTDAFIDVLDNNVALLDDEHWKDQIINRGGEDYTYDLYFRAESDLYGHTVWQFHSTIENDPIGGESLVPDNVGVVPEPTTMLLFGFGLLGLSGVLRRKK